MMIISGLPSSGAIENAISDSRDHPATQTGQEVGSLLRKVEQQILLGHTMDPANDNAVQTWIQVIHVAAAADTPLVRGELESFAQRLRAGSMRETTAGRQAIADDMKLFAGQASYLLDHSAPAAQSSSEAIVPTKPPGAPSEGDSLLTAVPKQDTPSAGVAAGAVPPPAAGNALGTARMGEAASDPGATERLSVPRVPPDDNAGHVPREAEADSYAKRGDEMLAAKDIPTARKYYAYAAIAGNARAAFALARTFDPGFVPRSGPTLDVPTLSKRPSIQKGLHRQRVRVSRTRTQTPEEADEQAEQRDRSVPW